MEKINKWGYLLSKGVIEAIESAYNRKVRVRFWYGDIATGKSWNEENDIIGKIGFSTGGINKIPILLQKETSIGGVGILPTAIIKIQETVSKRILYIHPTFVNGVYTFKESATYVDNKPNAKFRNEKLAKRYCDFMNGKRMNK